MNQESKRDEVDCLITYLQAGVLPAQIETDPDGDPLFVWNEPTPGTLEHEVLRVWSL